MSDARTHIAETDWGSLVEQREDVKKVQDASRISRTETTQADLLANFRPFRASSAMAGEFSHGGVLRCLGWYGEFA